MIIKIRNSDESWSYFECEVVHIRYVTLNKTPDRASCVNLISRSVPEDKEIKRLNLETMKSHLRSILTDQSCYLLNNQGKTIDRV